MLPRQGSRTGFGERQRFMLMLIAPAVVLLILFQAVPIFIGGGASFRDWMLYNPKKTWVGLSHYISVLTDPEFLKIVLPNTFLFMFASVIISLAAGLALAIALNRPFRGQKLVQTVLLLPLMVAPVIAAIMVRWIFNDQFGVVNAVLEAVGGTGQPWLVQRWYAGAISGRTEGWSGNRGLGRGRPEGRPRPQRRRSGAEGGGGRAPGRRGGERGEVKRNAKRERDREQQSQERGEQGAEDERKGAELLCDRIPDTGGDEVEAKSSDGQLGTANELDHQEEHQERNAQRRRGEQNPEDPVSHCRLFEGDRGLLRRWAARSEHGWHRAGV